MARIGGGASHRRPAARMSEADFARLVQDARERHNLSDIIGRHTKLTKSGRELVGICCFHSERSPSLTVIDQRGFYHCFGCGAHGDAISFLMQAEGMSFRQAIETLTGDAFPVVPEEERAKRKEQEQQELAQRVAEGRAIWSRAVPAPGTPAEVYARSRGIEIELPGTVRFVMTPRWRDRETGEVGRDHPAMVCALQDVTGAVVGVQCVFLMDGGKRKFERIREDGKKAPAKLTFGQVVGSALRLGPRQPHLIVCEGPEDGLTLTQQLPGKTVWVSCGTAMLSRLEYPPGVQSVCFAGDNNDAGRLAVSQARDAALSRGLRVSEVYPRRRFKDWNDELRGIEL